jgi:hypothetical protein
MDWSEPLFEEIKMDSEAKSYFDDFSGDREAPNSEPAIEVGE